MNRTRDNRFLSADDGAMGQFGLFMFMTMVVIGGLGLDVANGMMARTQLQVSADAVAHAALYTRELESADEARNVALSIASVNMPASKYGSVITAEDIKFGHWDAVNEQFQVDENSRDAVFVDAGRLQSTGNGVSTFFLRMAGLDRWDVRRGSVFETYYPTCFREGFVAEDIVDIQSNNNYSNGFCIHANDHVEVNSNNNFENGVIVSMPDTNNLVLPNSGFSSNTGLQEALRDGSYQIRILNRLPDIIDDLESAGPTYTPSYITGTGIITLSGKTVDAGDFTKGRVHRKTCSGNQSLTIKAGTTLEEIVLVTNCQIKVGNNVAFEDAIVATTNTGAKSVNGSHLRLGRDDNCATGGGAQLLTLGGVEVASSLEAFGGQIIAAGDIEFAANANGIEGASFISGGNIDGTSNMGMAFCGSGMENNFEAAYFRLAH